MKRIIALLALVVIIVGCSTPIEVTARNSIATASGFIAQAQADHKASCVPNPSQPVCIAINKAVSANNTAIDALEAYCGSAAFNAGTVACEPHAALADKLTAALQNLSTAITDVKGLAK